MFLLWLFSFHVFFSPLSYISSRIFDNVISKWTFCVRQFFRPKTIFKVAILKTKSATIAFFLLLLSSSSLLLFLFLFLFLLSSSFVTMILELLGLKKPAFWRLFTQMTANFVRLVFKKSARYVYYRHFRLNNT